MPQAPSSKVTTQFLVTAVLIVLGKLLDDTSWVAWIPDRYRPVVLLLLPLLGAVVAYYKAETRPPASAFRYRLPDDPHPGE